MSQGHKRRTRDRSPNTRSSPFRQEYNVSREAGLRQRALASCRKSLYQQAGTNSGLAVKNDPINTNNNNRNESDIKPQDRIDKRNIDGRDEWAAKSYSNDATSSYPDIGNQSRGRKLTPRERFQQNQARREAEKARRQGVLPPLRVAADSKGGMLLQKMGWREGQGLGKTGTGRLSPLSSQIYGEAQGLGFDDRSDTSWVIHASRCLRCGVIFDQFPTCYQHMQRLCYRANRENTTLPSLEECRVNEVGLKVLAFQCSTCAFIMARFKDLETHMQSVCNVTSSGYYTDYQVHVLPSFIFATPSLSLCLLSSTAESVSSKDIIEIFDEKPSTTPIDPRLTSFPTPPTHQKDDVHDADGSSPLSPGYSPLRSPSGDEKAGYSLQEPGDLSPLSPAYSPLRSPA